MSPFSHIIDVRSFDSALNFRCFRSLYAFSSFRPYHCCAAF